MFQKSAKPIWETDMKYILYIVSEKI